MKRKNFLIVIIVAALGIAGFAIWYFNNHRSINHADLVLYGNVDIRQVQLAFNGSERVVQMQAKEGDAVKKGQLLQHWTRYA